MELRSKPAKLQAIAINTNTMNFRKIYKFRSLADDCQTKRAVRILETGRFWFSRFWELNDPMEGVYRSNVDLLERKSLRTICSFSDRRALCVPTMWGYYANGFKGIAIEIEIPDDCCIKPVRYEENVPEGVCNENHVLLTKLKQWEHEHELRCVRNHSKQREKPVGCVTGVYIGSPYERLCNSQKIRKKKAVADYLKRARRIQKTAVRLNIQCYDATLVKGKVVLDEHQPAKGEQAREFSSCMHCPERSRQAARDSSARSAS